MVFEQRTAGPALHALVIGVGTYPHCGSGVQREKNPWHGLLANLEDLPGAVHTATATARWLVDEQAQEKALPLASLELAVSADSKLFFDGHEVQKATREGVEQSFAAWYERCDNEDSAALLYFCGHGMGDGSSGQLLLLQDFGAALNPFSHALDFALTYEDMRSCRAPVQCYFVDACREAPMALEPGYRARALVPVRPGPLYQRTTDLVLYSTEYGQRAYAPRDGRTHFSEAVRAAFAGAGAERHDDGLWRVTTQGLAEAVGKLMDSRPNGVGRLGVGGPDPGWGGGHAQRAAQGGTPGKFVLRELPGRPVVPFTVYCDPAEAQPEAELSLLDTGGARPLCHRPPGDPGLWQGEIDADTYDLRARFTERRWRDRLLEKEQVAPPLYRRSVPVRPR